MSNKRFIICGLLALVFIFSGYPVSASHVEMPAGEYFTLVDENNNIIHKTALTVYKNDEYISADNSRYKVVDIVGNIARCVYHGEETMPILGYDENQSAWLFEQDEIPVVSDNKKPTVAIYHTHSDESYVPTDGKESIAGDGGIYDVGQALASKLKKLGFNVEFSKNNHNPHDINAYSRSRRTAASLLKKDPDVIIDVHRDAVPADQYQAEVKGEDVTKVKLVVGRQNPNMKTNLEFAKKIKAVMDKKEPGLSNGIFMGKGDYNQDLSPRSILIEVGSHLNSKEDAKNGVALFAETIPSVLGIANTFGNDPAAKPITTDNQGAGMTILIILMVLAAAAGGYYLLNRGTAEK